MSDNIVKLNLTISQWEIIKKILIESDNKEVIDAVNLMLSPDKQFILLDEYNIEIFKTAKNGVITGIQITLPFEFLKKIIVALSVSQKEITDAIENRNDNKIKAASSAWKALTVFGKAFKE